MKEGHDAHNLRLDVVQQAVAKDKDLASIGLAEFGDDAAASLRVASDSLAASGCSSTRSAPEIES